MSELFSIKFNSYYKENSGGIHVHKRCYGKKDKKKRKKKIQLLSVSGNAFYDLRKK